MDFNCFNQLPKSLGTIKELKCLTIYGNPLPKEISGLFGALLVDYIDEHFKVPRTDEQADDSNNNNNN